MKPEAQTITLAITGASGAIYGWNLLQKLERSDGVRRVYLIISPTGRGILRDEVGPDLNGPVDLASFHLKKTVWLDPSDFGAPVASGSHPVNAMIVAPCSMASAGCMASGAGRNLIHRAADVTLKERRPLVLVPREAPWNLIHQENLLTLARAGATIVPASPAFYHHPQTIAELVDSLSYRVLGLLGFGLPPGQAWEGRP